MAFNICKRAQSSTTISMQIKTVMRYRFSSIGLGKISTIDTAPRRWRYGEASHSHFVGKTGKWDGATWQNQANLKMHICFDQHILCRDFSCRCTC